MNVNLELKTIHLTQINMYRLSAFPEDRIKILISELNINYDNINSYIDAGIAGEKLDSEIIKSFSNLNEMFRLAPPYNINHTQNSGDFRLSIDLLESIIALLNTEAGHRSTRKKILDLGWTILARLYNYSLNNLINHSLLHHWLKKNNLIKEYNPIYSSWGCRETNANNKIYFTPTDEDLESFYKSNRQHIYEYMIYNMNDQKQEYDPLSDKNSQESNYYHYHSLLKNIKI